jgi:hypothetical protein
VVGSSLLSWWSAAAAASPQAARVQTGTAPGSPPARPAEPASASELYVHTIARRDTLIALGRTLLTDPRRWRVIQKLNHVRNPRRLRPGAALNIPIALLKSVPGTAQVLWVRGSVRVARLDGTTIFALVGGSIGQGERVTTGAGDAVGLRLSTGATLTIGEHADVAFTELRRLPAANAARTGLDLRRGRIQNEVAPANVPGQRYEIRTPVVTTAVRGTTFRVGVDDAGATALAEVAEGRVGVAGAAGAVEVPAGFGTVARQDAPLAPPRALLPATTITAPGVQQRLPIRTGWIAIPGAARYRAEVRVPAPVPGAADALVAEQVLAATEAQWTDLPDGVYRVTVRGIDADGLEGTDASARLEVDARPEPPIAQAPAVDATEIGDRAAFAWTRPAGVASFDVEVTPVAPAPGGPLAGITSGFITDARTEAPLPPGRYTWRVRSRATLPDGGTDVGPWSDAFAFTLKARPPAGPPATADTTNKAALALQWTAGRSGDRYHVQLARDATFANPLVETTVAEPRLSTPKPAPGSYLVRVALVDADGLEGPFGPAQAFEVVKAKTRSWWWLAEPIGTLAALLVAAL